MKYLVCIEFSGWPPAEKWISADGPKEAKIKAWDGLYDDEKDIVESIEVIDEEVAAA